MRHLHLKELLERVVSFLTKNSFMSTSKNLFKFTTALLLAAILFSCDSPPEPLTGTVKDPEMAREAAGVYAGEIPCAGCAGIEYRINLRPDFTYEARMVYKGESEAQNTVELSGGYGFTEDGILVLEKEEPGMNYFKVEPAKLRMLNLEGKEITGILADKYVLTELTRARGRSAAAPEGEGPNNELMRKLHEQGVDFYARGNEPFWSLDLDFEGGFRFNTMSGMKINTPPVEGAMAMDADPPRTLYAAEVEAGALRFTIIGEECTDNMSGEIFTHTVEVEAKNGVDEAFTTFNGCGRYVTDYDLAGAWTLSSMGGEEIDTENLQKGAPQLTFDPDALRVSGHGSCNNLNGGFEMQKNAIRFSQMASTSMACPDLELETAFTEKLSGRQLKYELTDDELILIHPDGTEMVFRRG